MSGHSKWSTIKHKKGQTDAQRGKIFTKIGREISVAVKEGGADPTSNAKLRDLIAKAKSNNVPNDNIERAIKKAAGEGDKNNYETMVYEGYGPQGVAVIVEALTDNRNRTAADVRHYFDKFGGNLGTNGCVGYLFQEKGIILLENTSSIDQDQLLEDAIEAGADDVLFDGEFIEITTQPSVIRNVRETLEEKKYSLARSEVEKIPDTFVNLTDEDVKTKMEKLLEMLEDHDDVQNVWHNWTNDSEE